MPDSARAWRAARRPAGPPQRRRRYRRDCARRGPPWPARRAAPISTRAATRAQRETRAAKRRDQVGFDLHLREQAPRFLDLLAIVQRRRAVRRSKPFKSTRNANRSSSDAGTRSSSMLSSWSTKPSRAGSEISTPSRCVITAPPSSTAFRHAAVCADTRSAMLRMTTPPSASASTPRSAIGRLASRVAVRSRPPNNRPSLMLNGIRRNGIAGRKQIAQHLQPLSARGMHRGAQAHAAETGRVDGEQRRRAGRIFARRSCLERLVHGALDAG